MLLPDGLSNQIRYSVCHVSPESNQTFCNEDFPLVPDYQQTLKQNIDRTRELGKLHVPKDYYFVHKCRDSRRSFEVEHAVERYTKEEFHENQWNDDELKWLQGNVTELFSQTPVLWSTKNIEGDNLGVSKPDKSMILTTDGYMHSLKSLDDENTMGSWFEK